MGTLVDRDMVLLSLLSDLTVTSRLNTVLIARWIVSITAVLTSLRRPSISSKLWFLHTMDLQSAKII
jgi:hypothetical protein